MDIKELQSKVNDSFLHHFGRTPLRERLDNVMYEALELRRFTDLPNLREEAGDLLASAIQLCNENAWDIDEVVNETLNKIERRELQYKSLGRKINVAILGGAFNPITIGHIKLAQFVLDTSKTFDEVWIMPCFGHMYNKNMVSAEHRLEMCRIAAKTDGRIQVSDYEIKNELRGETYHLAKRLLDEDFAKDQYDFSIVIGLDNANTFDKWVNYQDLERMMRFVVVPRKGVNRDVNVNWYLNPPHIYLSPENDIPNISSTMIRDNFEILKDCENELDDTGSDIAVGFIKENLPDGVWSYIVKNNLYHINL